MKTLDYRLRKHDVPDIVKKETYKRFYIRSTRGINYKSKIERKEYALRRADKYLGIYGKKINEIDWEI